MTSPSEHDATSRTVCMLCRQRKTRCDRVLPRCGFCVKAKLDCQYVGQPKKRGLRAGYVNELEARIGTSIMLLSSHSLRLLMIPPNNSWWYEYWTSTTKYLNLLSWLNWLCVWLYSAGMALTY